MSLYYTGRYLDYTIKHIGLDLASCVAEFVKGIACLVCQGTVLNRGNDIDKYIVLEKKPSQNLINLHASAQAQVTGNNRACQNNVHQICHFLNTKMYFLP